MSQHVIVRSQNGLCPEARLGIKADMGASGNEQSTGGYSVAYSRDDMQFPVYVTAAVAAIFFAAAWTTGAAYWLAFAIAAAGFSYYNLPLLETDGPTMGANQYGIFIQPFGLLTRRAIYAISIR